jgi:CheY-like chemotaxis protein
MITLASLSSRVVLCIDDFESTLQLSRACLERHGYRVLTATSGMEGLNMLQAHAVDLLVLDYEMPIMNGEAVAREVRRTHPRLPIVLMSAHDDHDDRRPVRQLVDAYVPKIELVNRLHQTVAGLLAQADTPRAATA